MDKEPFNVQLMFRCLYMKLESENLFVLLIVEVICIIHIRSFLVFRTISRCALGLLLV
jgi:hypothetical protein